MRAYLEFKLNMPRGTTNCQLLDNRDAAEDPELCGNYTFWSQHPCPETATESNTKVFRCSGSFNGQCNIGVAIRRDSRIPDFPTECVDGSLQFTSRIDNCKEEWKCKVKGTTVCVDKGSRCDLVPLCDDGRDERDCKEEYLRKGLIQRGADFECQSQEYNSEAFANTEVDL